MICAYAETVDSFQPNDIFCAIIMKKEEQEEKQTPEYIVLDLRCHKGNLCGKNN